MKYFKSHHGAGFTLLELLVAVSIMAISLGLLYRASGSSARTAGDLDRYREAAVLAQSLLAARDAVLPGGWTESGELEGLRWQVHSQRYESEVARERPTAVPLHQVFIQIDWGGANERPRSLSLTTLRPQLAPEQLAKGQGR